MSQNIPSQRSVALTQIGNLVSNSTDSIHTTRKVCFQAMYPGRGGMASSIIEPVRRIQALMQYLPLRDEIEAFWRNPELQRAATWTEHQDINEVMLATSLAPNGFLVLLPSDD